MRQYLVNDGVKAGGRVGLGGIQHQDMNKPPPVW